MQWPAEAVRVRSRVRRAVSLSRTTGATNETLPTLAEAAGLPSLADGHQSRRAQVELMRGQTRFVAAMEQARRLIEAAIG
jgi:hypothetical protein